MSPASACGRSKPKRFVTSAIHRAAGRCVSTSNNKEFARRLRQVESRNITFVSGDFPVFWERAEGSEVRDSEGRSYIDLTSAFAVSSLGHRSTAVYRAILKQSKRMWHG